MSEPKTFYVKRGRRYYPVSYYDSDLLEAMPAGAHLVIVHPGGRSIRYGINPDHAALLAAARVAEESMVKAIQATAEARQGRSASRPLNEREQKAFAEYKRLSGASCLLLEHPSAQEIAEAGIRALIEAAKNG